MLEAILALREPIHNLMPVSIVAIRPQTCLMIMISRMAWILPTETQKSKQGASLHPIDKKRSRIERIALRETSFRGAESKLEWED